MILKIEINGRLYLVKKRDISTSTDDAFEYYAPNLSIVMSCEHGMSGKIGRHVLTEKEALHLYDLLEKISREQASLWN